MSYDTPQDPMTVSAHGTTPAPVATPRTDAQPIPNAGYTLVSRDFARTLERELQSAQAALAQAKAELESLKRVKKYRDNLKADEQQRAESELTATKAALAEAQKDKERLDWIASRKSTELVHFCAAGWAIINPAGGDLLHEYNLHDLRAAIDAARRAERGEGGNL